MIDIMRDWWGVVLSVIGGLAWLVRLESRGLANEKDIKRLWTQRKEDLSEAKAARDSTNAMLHEMRQDIKTLLSRRADE